MLDKLSKQLCSNKMRLLQQKVRKKYIPGILSLTKNIKQTKVEIYFSEGHKLASFQNLMKSNYRE